MLKLQIIKLLFIAYIGVIILFNFVTVPIMNTPYFQLFMSLAVILFIIWMIEYTYSKRKIVYWSMAIFSGLGVVRPFIELIFSRVFPEISTQIFPAFTPFFSVFGVIIMILIFLFIINNNVFKYFSKN
ncbi:MAG: hypothetical protein ACI870_000350 [Crocinitomicaceae bacterium]|jgi:hypothetical protein